MTFSRNLRDATIFFLESNLISQFEENVISFDFLAKALDNFKQIQICFIHQECWCIHFTFFYSNHVKLGKGYVFKTTDILYKHLLVQSSYEDMFLPATPLLVKNLTDILLLLYRFSLSVHIVSAKNILAENSNDH